MDTLKLSVAFSVAALGAAGAVLTTIDSSSPVTRPLTLVFLLAVPALSVALLLPGLTPLARAIVAGTASIALVGMVAEIMLAFSAWSPRGAVIVTALICAAMTTAGPLLNHRRTRPANGSEAHSEDEDWIYEH